MCRPGVVALGLTGVHGDLTRLALELREGRTATES
jgi:hypothetical protein